MAEWPQSAVKRFYEKIHVISWATITCLDNMLNVDEGPVLSGGKAVVFDAPLHMPVYCRSMSSRVFVHLAS